ncbi:MAG: hypothetical protein L3J54_08600 [Draconibacterium sp.]|nr:hypothetical protein [Draconibacterium sp.]
MIYKSHCSCTGNSQVTVFVTPETCESESNKHHQHKNESSCSFTQCEVNVIHTEDCGCSSPESIYFKLQNQVIDEEVKFIKVQPIHIIASSNNINIHILDESEPDENRKYSVVVPPIFISSLDFLILIRKLKISLLA